MKHEVNAMGKQCPIPVVMTKKVIDNAAVGDEIEILIDNETAVNNLSRLANKTGCTFVSEKLGDKKYQVKMVVTGQWKKPGVFNVEEFDPDPYMEALNKWGLPWKVCEDPELVKVWKANED